MSSRRDGRGAVHMRRHEQRAMEVLRQFRRVYGPVRRHFRDIEARCGLSASHVWMLHEIFRNPDVGLSELASRLSIHASTASQLVDRLVRDGLVRKLRSTQDQRRIGLRLTAKGCGTLQHVPQPAEGLLPGALLALPDSTLQSLHVSLDALLRQLGEVHAGDAETPLADL